VHTKKDELKDNLSKVVWLCICVQTIGDEKVGAGRGSEVIETKKKQKRERGRCREDRENEKKKTIECREEGRIILPNNHSPFFCIHFCTFLRVFTGEGRAGGRKNKLICELRKAQFGQKPNFVFQIKTKKKSVVFLRAFHCRCQYFKKSKREGKRGEEKRKKAGRE
jgi:hypothetical protein